MLQKTLDWMWSNTWLIEIGFFAVGTVAAFVGWNIMHRRLTRASDATSTDWDDIFIKALGVPVSVFIVVAGTLQIALVGAQLLDGRYPQLQDTLAAGRLLLALTVVFWIALRLVNGVEGHYRRRSVRVGDREIGHGTLHAVFQTLRAMLFVAALLTAMEAMGLSIAGILTFGGIGGVLIGFAAKDTLANFFSGLLIFLERPFVVGDWIRRPDADIEGTVENIGWRMTQIRTFDKRPLYVPNSLFFNSVIENPQRMTNRRIYQYIGVRYEDIGRLPAMLQSVRDMLATHDGIDQQQICMVNFDRYGACSLDFFVYAMTRTIDWAEFHAVKEDVLLKIAAIVREHGCDFAFPTRTLHVAPSATPPPLAPPAAGLAN